MAEVEDEKSIWSLEDPGYSRWLAEQARLTKDVIEAHERYDKFHKEGYLRWRKRWLKFRMVK